MAGNDDVIGRVDEEDVNDVGGQSNPTPDVISEGGNVSNNSSVQQEPNTRFLTNILYENNGSVYGLEVLLFDIDDNPIETILVVDETSFDSWTELTKQLKEVVVPYTEGDALLLEQIQIEREKVGKVQSNGEKYTYNDYLDYLNDIEVEGKWSTLKNLGSLENVLKNVPIEVKNASGVLTTQYPVEINATSFMGMQSDEFSKVGHEHNYSEKPHSSVTNEYGLGTNEVYGHVKTINNLSSVGYVTGEALSAYQGKLLNDKIDTVDKKNSWSQVIKSSDSHLNYKINEDLRLVVCNLHIKDYTGLASKTGKHELYKAGTIRNAYSPSARVTKSMYRGDVVLYYDTNGSVNIYNLTKIKKMNLNAQVIWHY